jgi:hypothetical protein
MLEPIEVGQTYRSRRGEVLIVLRNIPRLYKTMTYEVEVQTLDKSRRYFVWGNGKSSGRIESIGERQGDLVELVYLHSKPEPEQLSLF